MHQWIPVLWARTSYEDCSALSALCSGARWLPAHRVAACIACLRCHTVDRPLVMRQTASCVGNFWITETWFKARILMTISFLPLEFYCCVYRIVSLMNLLAKRHRAPVIWTTASRLTERMRHWSNKNRPTNLMLIAVNVTLAMSSYKHNWLWRLR